MFKKAVQATFCYINIEKGRKGEKTFVWIYFVQDCSSTENGKRSLHASLIMCSYICLLYLRINLDTECYLIFPIYYYSLDAHIN